MRNIGEQRLRERWGTWCSCVVVVAGLFAACTGEPDHVPFVLNFQFNSTNGGPRACEKSCDEYGFSCRGRLGVRIVDAENPDIEHAFRCIDAPDTSWEVTGSLCDLQQADITFHSVPVGMARFEVALWREDQLGDDRRCLRGPLFDLQGEPLVTVYPQPVVAGATYAEIGSSSQIHVPMACISPAEIDQCVAEP